MELATQQYQMASFPGLQNVLTRNRRNRHRFNITVSSSFKKEIYWTLLENPDLYFRCKNGRQWKELVYQHAWTLGRELGFQAHVKPWRRGCNELQSKCCLLLSGPWAALHLLEIVYVHRSCDHGAMISGCWQCDSGKGMNHHALLHIGENQTISTVP